jgi:hypothetical protein
MLVSAHTDAQSAQVAFPSTAISTTAAASLPTPATTAATTFVGCVTTAGIPAVTAPADKVAPIRLMMPPLLLSRWKLTNTLTTKLSTTCTMATLLTTRAAALSMRYSYASGYRLLFMLDFLSNKRTCGEVYYCVQQSSLSRPALDLFRFPLEVIDKHVDHNSETSLSRSKDTYQHKILIAIAVRYCRYR